MPSPFTEEEQIRMALVQWWHGDARLGMTATYCTLRDAVRRLKRADTELRRAGNADNPERLNRAGTDYAVAKINLFKLVK